MQSVDPWKSKATRMLSLVPADPLAHPDCHGCCTNSDWISWKCLWGLQITAVFQCGWCMWLCHQPGPAALLRHCSAFLCSNPTCSHSQGALIPASQMPVRRSTGLLISNIRLDNFDILMPQVQFRAILSSTLLRFGWEICKLQVLTNVLPHNQGTNLGS